MKNQRKSKFKLSIVLSLLFLFSCAEKDSGHLRSYKGLEGMVIKIPQSIKPLNTDKSLEDFLTENDQNIVIVLKSGCMSCIVELDRWSEWSKSEELIRKSPISVVIVHPITYLLEQEITTKHNYPFPIYNDSNSELGAMNGLDMLDGERLLILDHDFRIVFLGSPLTFPELKNGFLNFIDR